MNHIYLYSVQPVCALNILQSNTPYITEVDFVTSWGDQPDYPWGFEHAYNWMVNQMKLRVLVNTHQAAYPVWAWARYDQHRYHPDKRSLLKDARNQKESLVLLTLRVPFEQVLISDFSLWHSILNCASISRSSSEYEQRERLMRQKFKKAYPKSNPPTILHERDWDYAFMIQSWNRIFQLQPRPCTKKEHYTFDLIYPYARKQWLGDLTNRSAQACLWHIDPNWVVDTTLINYPFEAQSHRFDL